MSSSLYIDMKYMNNIYGWIYEMDLALPKALFIIGPHMIIFY